MDIWKHGFRVFRKGARVSTLVVVCFHTSSSESAAWMSGISGEYSSLILLQSSAESRGSFERKQELGFQPRHWVTYLFFQLIDQVSSVGQIHVQAPVFLCCRSRCVGPVLLMLNCSGKHHCYVILLCNLHCAIP